MRKLLVITAVAASLAAGAVVAQPAAPAAAPAAAGKLSSKSSLIALLKNPAAKAVLKKHIPQVIDFTDSNGTDMLPPEMTVADLQQIAEAGVTADMIAAIDKDLATL